MTILLTLWKLGTQNWWGRIIAASMALLIAWKANNYFVGKKAVSRFVESSVKDGKKRNAKAAEVRASARQPGAAERLRRDACRDC